MLVGGPNLMGRVGTEAENKFDMVICMYASKEGPMYTNH